MYIENLINKIKLPFRKDKELYRRLYAILGFYPKNIALYKQALCHKSLAVKGKDGRSENNERLEFLGDAILDAIVGDIVYRHFQGKNEGFLTNTRSKLVQREMLGKIAVEMGIDKLVRYNGQNQTPHSFMAGNAFEALVGAIYLDYGYARCMEFMKQRILSKLVNIDKVAYKEVNFKSKLLEWSQKNRIRLVYEDSEQRKTNGNSSTFYSEVIVEGITCGSGKGFSKKEAQQNASKDALYRLKKEKGLEQRVFDAKGKRTAMEEQPQALLPEIPDELLKPQQKQASKQTPKQTPKQTAQSPKKDENEEKKAEKRTARVTEKKGDRPADKKDEKPVEKHAEKPAEKQPIERPVKEPAGESGSDNSDNTPNEEVAKKKPRRRHSHKPKTSLKPNTENSGSEAV